MLKQANNAVYQTVNDEPGFQSINRVVAPQNSSARKVNDLGVIRISDKEANTRLKLLGQPGTLRRYGKFPGLHRLIFRPRPEGGYPLAR